MTIVKYFGKEKKNTVWCGYASKSLTKKQIHQLCSTHKKLEAKQKSAIEYHWERRLEVDKEKNKNEDVTLMHGCGNGRRPGITTATVLLVVFKFRQANWQPHG